MIKLLFFFAAAFALSVAIWGPPPKPAKYPQFYVQAHHIAQPDGSVARQ
jgi:hypothetical protein